jgi:predicted nuclease with TOPRIM domain
MPYFEHVQLVSYKKEYNIKDQTIVLSVVGKEITPEEITILESLLHKQYGLENATLVIRQTDNLYNTENENELLEKILERKDAQLMESQRRIDELEKELAKNETNNQLSQHIAKELAVQYPSITSISIVKMVYTDTKSLKKDTIPTLFIDSKQSLSSEQKQNLLKWMRVRLDEPKLVIK